jgi:spoIIIJ-associated protein
MDESKDDERTIEQLSEEADIAADYLEKLLDIMDMDGDIELGVRNNRPIVQIVADDNSDIESLIGEDGKVVEALQRLARLAVQQKTGDRSHLILDVDGYLHRKHQKLEDIAVQAIDDVREFGKPVNLDPMNSFERKVIHDIVREEGLKSRSHGDEPKRYVTIYMKADNDSDSDADSDIDSDVEDFQEDSVNE